MLLARTNNPLVPAKAETQGGKLRSSNKWLWIPACAGMSGTFCSCLAPSHLDQCIGDPHPVAAGTDEYRIEVDRREPPIGCHDEIRKAQQALWQKLRLVAEPGGAAAFAALLSGAYEPKAGERIGVVLCGANADLESWQAAVSN